MNKNWKIKNERLCRDFKFKNFPEAISFMVAVSFEAEKLNHHPEWRNVYSTVFVELITHDTNSITDKDYALAEAFDAVFERYVV